MSHRKLRGSRLLFNLTQRVGVAAVRDENVKPILVAGKNILSDPEISDGVRVVRIPHCELRDRLLVAQFE